MARRYHLWPFDKRVVESYDNIYQRALLLAILETKTDEQHIIESLNKRLPEFLITVLDIVGTAIYNAVIASGFTKLESKKRAYTKNLLRIQKSKDADMTVKIPDPEKPGEFKTVKVKY